MTLTLPTSSNSPLKIGLPKRVGSSATRLWFQTFFFYFSFTPLILFGEIYLLICLTIVLANSLEHIC